MAPRHTCNLTGSRFYSYAENALCTDANFLYIFISYAEREDVLMPRFHCIMLICLIDYEGVKFCTFVEFLIKIKFLEDQRESSLFRISEEVRKAT